MFICYFVLFGMGSGQHELYRYLHKLILYRILGIHVPLHLVYVLGSGYDYIRMYLYHRKPLMFGLSILLLILGLWLMLLFVSYLLLFLVEGG